MKTAIIYRSNKNLDKNLAGLKNKVDLFHAFPAGATTKEITEKIVQLIGTKTDIDHDVDVYKTDFKKIICDVTCFESIRYVCLVNILEEKIVGGIEHIIIKQGCDGHEEYASQIANEAKELDIDVVIAKKYLADHCVVGEIDVYCLTREEKDGSFLEKVVNIWTQVMTKAGVNFEIITDNNIEIESLIGKMIINDDHNRELGDKIYEMKKKGEIIYRAAYSARQNMWCSVEEIPIW